MTARRILFGLVVPAAKDAERIEALTKLLGETANLTVERYHAPSYEALATEVREGRVDVAWLPPIVYVRLADVVTALGSIERGGQSTYEAALVVRGDSRIKTLDALRGTRAGWVDPWSAAGFVMPRMKLALLGIDPRTVFRTETFHGSHRATMQALADGACDVAGAYARADEKGNVSSGAWSEVEGADVRVLATFGAIPPDVIAARKDLPDHDRLSAAMRSLSTTEASRAIVHAVFDGDVGLGGLADGYEALEKALTMASGRGLFD